MWNEFKKFALKGNVIDLAIGVIIGGAFGKIVTSLVNDVMMPVLGLLSGGLDFSGLSYTIGDATVAYGLFLQTVFDFFVVAVSIFFFVRALNRFRKKEEEAPAEPPKPSAEEKLLMEIRDLLKAQRAEG